MPQHAKRLKVRRKDLRKPDEFETLTGQAVDWAQTHRSFVIGAGAVVVAVALVALGVGRWRASRNESAAIAFATAQASFEAGQFGPAGQGFMQAAEDYPGTPFGRLAKLYRAHALARQGESSDAATAYGEYLAGTPDTEYLRQEGLFGLGHAKEASGDAAGALDAFTQAGALNGPYRTDALLGVARLQDAAGHAAEARAIYDVLLKDAADDELKALLTAKLAASGEPRAAQPEAQ